MKKALNLILAAVLALSLAACGNAPSAGGNAANPQRDRSGNPIQIPDEVNTIVSLAASTTRILDDLGAADRLVAVDMFSVGNLSNGAPDDMLVMDMTAPDLEQLAALMPDVVFVSPISSGGGDDIFAVLREGGACIIEIPTPGTVAGVLEDVQFIADCVGLSAEGEALVQEAQQVLDDVARRLDAGNAAGRPVVYFEVSPLPYLYSTGGGTYLDDMISLAGGVNLFAAENSWVSITEEAVVNGMPDVIFTGVNYVDDAVGEILARAGWETLPAIEGKQVYYVENRDSQEPTHHVAGMVLEMAKLLHPALFD